MVIEIDAFVATTIGMLVFFLGALLTREIAFLRNFNIPEPVSGGLAVALITWAIFAFFNREIRFDLSVRDFLLVVFFTTIGLNARLSDLIAGGKLLGLLLLATVVFIVFQNVVGLVGAYLFDFPAPVSVLVGSAALIGGHGTAIAWGPTIEAATGFTGAAEIGIASATLGLIVAALVGGPIAKFLIERHRLIAEEGEKPMVGLEFEEKGDPGDSVSHVSLMRSMLAINLAILFGYSAHYSLSEAGLQLPLFVPCLIVGILISNVVPMMLPKLVWPARTRAMAVISDYSLSVFLAMSLMSMQMWTLVELGGPLFGILCLQVLMTVVFVLLVVFPITGRNYTSAVLSAGFAGFGLGATPTAIANMTSVTKNYGPAPMAFIVLPLVSAFFVDLVNAVVIQFFVSL